MKKITPTKKEERERQGKEGGSAFFCMKLDELVAGSTKSKDGAAACKELREDAMSVGGRLIECGRIRN